MRPVFVRGPGGPSCPGERRTGRLTAMTADDVRTAVAQRFRGSDAAPGNNEFVIFSKPELGRLTGDDLDKVWDLFA